MTQHVKPAPKHRGESPRRGAEKPRSAYQPTRRAATRRAIKLSSVAAAATGFAVTGGVLAATADAGEGPMADAGANTTADIAALAAPAKLSADEIAEIRADRAAGVSRSDTRAAALPEKRSTLDVVAGEAATRTESLADEDPRVIGRALLAEFGFGEDQWGCLEALWTKESGWNVYADNPTSSAYGIPQALPGSKMASAGADWADNPVTQIRWGLGYIQARYGTPCAAWGHSQAVNWY